MSKVLKIIAGVLMVCFVISALAIVVPPLLGVTTIVSRPSIETNISTGTVVYVTRKPITNISAGDEIVYEGENSAFLFKVEEVYVTDGEVYVSDEVGKTSGTVSTGTSVLQKGMSIPLIGYLIIAVESTDGIILLGLGIAVLIMLYVLGEVMDLRKRSLEEDDEYFTDEDEYFASLAASISKPSKLDELSAPPSAAKIKEEPSNEATVPAADGNAEKPSENEEAAPEEAEKAPEETEAGENAAAASEEETAKTADIPEASKAESGADGKAAGIVPGKIDETLAGNVDSIPDDESLTAAKEMSESDLSDVESALEAALATTQVSRQPQALKPAQEETPAEGTQEQLDEIELAMPVRTLEEYLQKAYTDGDDPQVIKDKITGVNLVDFSDCFKEQ